MAYCLDESSAAKLHEIRSLISSGESIALDNLGNKLSECFISNLAEFLISDYGPDNQRMPVVICKLFAWTGGRKWALYQEE